MTRSILLSLLLAATLSSTAYAEPASQPASRPTGKWYCWSDCTRTYATGFGKNSIWFSGKASLRRYDVKTQQMRTFTPLDGLPLEWSTASNITVAEDETCAIRLSDSKALAVYLWRPKLGWQRLPQLQAGGQLWQIAFDPTGRLHALLGTSIYRWSGGEWKKVRDIPPCQRFVPLKNGFLLVGLKIRKGSRVSKVMGYITAGGDKPLIYEFQKGWLRLIRHFHINGKTLGMFRGKRGKVIFCWITPDKLVVELECVGLDLTGKGFLKLTKPSSDNRRRGYEIGSIDGAPITYALLKRSGFGFFFVRDANGHLWNGSYRWDGKVWKQIVPNNHLADHSKVMDRRKFVFDESAMTWKRTNKHVFPAMQRTYDPLTRTAWWQHRVNGKNVWQHIRLTGKKREVLRTVDAPDLLGGPKCKDAAGNWWGPGRRTSRHRTPEQFFAVRFDKDGQVHTYPCKRGFGGGYMPQMQISPTGGVWLWTERECSRYDAKTDKFAQAEPWEEFSFKFGSWKLSIAGKISSSGQSIYRKEAGEWKPLSNPFRQGKAVGNRSMIYRDRMLITAVGVGVLEYDATNDRWAVLYTPAAFKACFDKKGRRILVNRNCVLMYDGDPFSTNDKDTDKNTALFSKLLKLMDNNEWRVRDKATQEMKNLAKTMRGRLEAAFRRTDISLEVRVRIEHILKEAGAGKTPPLPPSLFRQMHPLLKPVK